MSSEQFFSEMIAIAKTACRENGDEVSVVTNSFIEVYSEQIQELTERLNNWMARKNDQSYCAALLYSVTPEIMARSKGSTRSHYTMA